MQRIESSPPSPEFAQCWRTAGLHLETVAKRDAAPITWLKAQLVPPFLEHLSFRLGNQLFFVRVQDVEGSVEGPGSVSGLMSIADGCKGHPCILRVRRAGRGWEVVDRSWGLTDAKTGRPVDPVTLVSDELVEMTEWELHDFALQVVRGELEKEGRGIMSSANHPGVDPSIWFFGDQGPEWIVVRAVRYPLDHAEPPSNWAQIAEACAGFSARGNFASVAVASANERFGSPGRAATPLWRGAPMVARYEGLVRMTVPQSSERSCGR